MNWDYRFFEIAKQYASWSKDPSKKIGAVAVDPIHRRVLSAGYNGFPRGILDSDERLNERETKYKYIVHAEQNCIYNATYDGVCLEGAHMYVYGLPVCSECAKGIIQVGIKKVYMQIPTDCPEKWIESCRFANSMFGEAGVEVKMLNL